MTSRVVVLPRAEREFEEQYRYVAARSTAGAASWANAFFAALETLETSAGSSAPESEDHDEDIRQILFRTRRGRTYRALFVVRDGTVYVLHVRGAGQETMKSEDVELPE